MEQWELNSQRLTQLENFTKAINQLPLETEQPEDQDCDTGLLCGQLHLPRGFLPGGFSELFKVDYLQQS